MSIEIRSHFTDWHEVTESQALKFIATLYGGATCPDKLNKLMEHVRGIDLTEEQVIHEWNRIRNERMCKSTE